jgi:hypothetical protein
VVDVKRSFAEGEEERRERKVVRKVRAGRMLGGRWTRKLSMSVMSP